MDRALTALAVALAALFVLAALSVLLGAGYAARPPEYARRDGTPPPAADVPPPPGGIVNGSADDPIHDV
jgi:hypothetical protein